MTKTTKFKLVGPKGTITTVHFGRFAADPDAARAAAEKHVLRQKEGWEATMFAGEPLQIVEE